MQIISIGDNLHEMSNPVFWGKQEKYFSMSSAENFIHVPLSDECQDCLDYKLGPHFLE